MGAVCAEDLAWLGTGRWKQGLTTDWPKLDQHPIWVTTIPGKMCQKRVGQLQDPLPREQPAGL